MALIELEGIKKTYVQGELKTEVLKGINLQVERGEFLAIIGPSGSGKSTLMYIMGCLDKPTEGRYILDGKEVSRLSDDELSRIRGMYIGFVFQSFYLVPYLNALENVLLPTLYIEKSYRKEIFSNQSPESKGKELLKELGMEERLYYRPDQLSGGQKQRVAIARALINSPEIIIADEPTGQLDRKSGKAVMEILNELNKQGKTLIVVTHDPEVAKFASRIVKIEDGQLKPFEGKL
jgi:putative ABC transport system ATP-binding protein